MKKVISLLALLFLTGVFSVHAQELTARQQEIVDQYDLRLDDHRSVEFTTDVSNAHAQYPDVKTAIEAFFTTQLKRDYTRLAITNTEGSYFDQTLSILDLIDLYIELTPNETLPNE
ncbi:MAG: hypothetical protein HUJ25_02480 [Crocinitomicaceae bacterium]|nr:hypothetical protein [Crocinitomicaceae bacterium]